MGSGVRCLAQAISAEVQARTGDVPPGVGAGSVRQFVNRVLASSHGHPAGHPVRDPTAAARSQGHPATVRSPHRHHVPAPVGRDLRPPLGIAPGRASTAGHRASSGSGRRGSLSSFASSRLVGSIGKRSLVRSSSSCSPPSAVHGCLAAESTPDRQRCLWIRLLLPAGSLRPRRRRRAGPIHEGAGEPCHQARHWPWSSQASRRRPPLQARHTPAGQMQRTLMALGLLRINGSRTADRAAGCRG